MRLNECRAVKALWRIQRSCFRRVLYDDDDSVCYVDGHLLLCVYGTSGECFDLLKKRFATPGGWVTRVNMDRDEVALMAHEHLALIGAPLGSECR